MNSIKGYRRQAMGFATFFRRERPKASEQELCDLVVAQSKRIDQLLNMPIPTGADA